VENRDRPCEIWISPDAYRQFSSPYAYSPNPVNSVDPDGNWVDNQDEGFCTDDGLPFEGMVYLGHFLPNRNYGRELLYGGSNLSEVGLPNTSLDVLALAFPPSVAAGGGVLEGANFAQKTFSPMFSKGGAFAGRSVADVSSALRSGAMNASEVPINYIVRGGNKLILNTRSAKALEGAGIPRSGWNAVNRSGQGVFEDMLSGQLRRNGLPDAGTATVRQSGL
jgi:hypothetical protein